MAASAASAASPPSPGARGVPGTDGAPAAAAGTSLAGMPLAVPLTPTGEHALNSSWTFWFDKKLRREEWEARKKANPALKWGDLLRTTCSVDTVEAFWRVYLHLKRPAEVPDGVNVYLFRSGQQPAWEEYPYGGCWILKFKRAGGARARSDAGRVWQAVLLALVGEACLDTDVVGASLAVRPKEHLVSIWNRDNRDEARRFRIADRLKTVLGLEPSTRIEYKWHVSSMRDKSTYANAQGFTFVAEPGSGGGARGGRSAPGTRGRSAASGSGGSGGSGGGRRGGSGRGGGRAPGSGGRARQSGGWRTRGAAAAKS